MRLTRHGSSDPREPAPRQSTRIGVPALTVLDSRLSRPPTARGSARGAAALGKMNGHFHQIDLADLPPGSKRTAQDGKEDERAAPAPSSRRGRTHRGRSRPRARRSRKTEKKTKNGRHEPACAGESREKILLPMRERRKSATRQKVPGCSRTEPRRRKPLLGFPDEHLSGPAREIKRTEGARNPARRTRLFPPGIRFFRPL